MVHMRISGTEPSEMRKRCIKFSILSDAVHMVREHRQNAIQYLYLHLFYNKFCLDIAYLNTKMAYLSDFKRTKSKILRTASRRN